MFETEIFRIILYTSTSAVLQLMQQEIVGKSTTFTDINSLFKKQFSTLIKIL